MKSSVSILVFEDVEVMDFAGPFEVFSVTNELNDDSLFDLEIIAQGKAPVRAKGGLSINPDHGIEEITSTDILIIPGGSGTRQVIKDETLVEWVGKVGTKAKQILSVCTGSHILAKAGLLDHLKATTHHQTFERLGALAPRTEVLRDARFVDNGRVITSAGISAGIDASLHVIGKLIGNDIREATARYMEYSDPPSTNQV
ncbi:MAG: DJ-1/PfpI family protein [Akkermansiaceae bacterium]|jgi:transcriptional regulator GlxA family with amidase domain